MTRVKLAAIALLAGTMVPGFDPVFAAETVATRSSPTLAGFDAAVAAAKAAMVSDPDVALTEGRKATAAAAGLRGPEAVTASVTGRLLQGDAMTRLNRAAEGKLVLEGALLDAARHAPGSKLHADVLKAHAAALRQTGGIQAALGGLHQAHAIYTKLGEARSQAVVLQNIGSIYQDARDFPRALRYYEQSSEIFSDDPALVMASHNNRGVAFKELGEFAKAEAEFGKALSAARQMESPLLEVRIMTNIASAQQLQGRLPQADATAAEGLRRAQGAAAEWRPFLWGVRAQVAHARGDVAGAIQLFERTFSGVDLAESPLPFRDFHETARYAYEALGRDREALAHFAAFKRLYDKGRDVAVNTNSALMAARFDAANQELRITRLKSAKAAREAELARSEERLRNITLLSAVGGTAGAAVLGAVLFAFGVSRRSRREVSKANTQLTFAARHDGLTGLANRAYSRELLAEALEASRDGAQCALLLVDLDRFKAVNDTLGHHAGDALLQEVARRLNAVVGGTAHTARLGGDEFAVVVPRADGEIEALAARIVAKLGAPYEIEGKPVHIGATVGVAIGPVDGATADALTRCADLALYQAKDAGRGRFARYEPWMQAAADDRRLIELDLRRALAEDHLALAYQPIIDAETGEIAAYEALLRWTHPTRGEIPPSVFVKIAEEARLINEIGAWVLRTALHQAASWPEHIKIAVNLSALQVEADGLASTVVQALAASGVQPGRVELEVTESVFLRQGPSTDATLERLRAIGVGLALDDFGTGYSSLGYLQRASFSKIKIDRSFVRSAAGGCQESIAVIQAIITLARSLGMETTAEGIETEEEFGKMRELGCSQYQGFLFGKPVIPATTAASAEAEPEADRSAAAA